MRSRRWLWLVLAAGLLGLAIFLMGRGDPPEKTPAVEKVNFPNRLRPDEYERLEKRRTLRPELVKALEAAGKPPPKRPSDPVLAALPPAGSGKTAVVFEANALRNSPVGELLLDCLRARTGQGNPFDDLKKTSGIDPLVDVDRVAVTSDGVMVSGNFAKADWTGLFKGASSQEPYGDKATMYLAPSVDGQPPTRAVGVWNGQMVVSGTPEQVKTMIDRLDGKGPDEAPILGEGDTYGEVYGVLAPKDVGDLLGPQQKELAQEIQDVASQVKLHVDAQNDVAVVADLSGPDGQRVTDLGKTLGGVLSLGRLKAQSDGDQDLADLLDLAKVVPEDGKFRTELALPMDFLLKKLAWCRAGNDAGTSAPAPTK